MDIKDRGLIGKRIKERRELAGLTQEQVGNKIGKKFTTVAKYESGEIKNIDILTIADIADITNTDLEYLLLKTNIPEKKEDIKNIPILGDKDLNEKVKFDIFGYKAINNEMAPLLDVEDIAIIKKEKELENNKTYLLKYEDKILIRKIIDNGNNNITLQAMNPYYPIINTTKDKIEIIGKVIKAENSSAFK